jgi:nucleoside-diphosphate-sugar epimerase
VSGRGPVFVTGASGFIGGQLAERLLAAGRPVRVLARRPLPALEKHGATIIPGDLHDLPALRRGCDGATAVFHVAGRVGVWGPVHEFFRVNVGGTQNVIAACRALGVPRLIYTSSPSVVYTGGNLTGVDESAPLCTAAPSAYPTSKAAAERAVAQAHGPELSTVSLRPHLVWGPGDRNVIPRVLAQARKGRLKIVGPGRNRVDCTHSTNVIDAHLLAEEALIIGGGVPPRRISADEGVLPPRNPGGKAYFITNGEPVVLWDWINELLRGLGEPEITKHISAAAAHRLGGLFEALWRVLPLRGEPPMTRFIAKELATDHWFNITAARRDLGYNPRVTMAAGTAELVALLRSGQAG